MSTYTNPRRPTDEAGMFLRLLLVVALLLTACSSAPEVVELASPEAGGDAPVETVAPTTQPPDPRPQKKSPAKTQPVTTTTATVVLAPSPGLDPATAVLGGVVIDGGDSSGFESEHYGYGPIDPQTDCDPFNLFDNGHFDNCPPSLDPWVLAAMPPNTITAGAPGSSESALRFSTTASSTESRIRSA